MATNLKDTYSIKIRPDFDKKSVDKFKKDVENPRVSALGSAFSSTTTKVAGLIGSMTLLGFAVSSIKKGFDDANKGVNEFLSATDRLSTIAGPMKSQGTSSGQLAITDLAIASAGVSQQERDLLYRNIQKSMKEGTLKTKGKTDISSILAGLQEGFKEAIKNKDTATMEQIQAITGLRGQKSLEFLQGNLKQDEATLLRKSGISSVDILTKNIEYGGILEGKQATLNAINELQNINKTSQTLQQKGATGITRGENIINVEAKTRENQINLLQEQIKGFDASRRASESLDSTMKSVSTALQSGVDKLAPALNGINDTINQLKQGISIVDIAKNIGSTIATAVIDTLKGGKKDNSKQVKR